jgi:hypothetical protein
MLVLDHMFIVKFNENLHAYYVQEIEWTAHPCKDTFIFEQDAINETIRLNKMINLF